MLCEKCVHSDVCVIKCMHRKEERKEMIACKNFMRKADVAPRAEVAREIFEEIEKCTVRKVVHDGKVVFDTSERFAELKKKYTGEQKNG